MEFCVSVAAKLISQLFRPQQDGTKANFFAPSRFPLQPPSLCTHIVRTKMSAIAAVSAGSLSVVGSGASAASSSASASAATAPMLRCTKCRLRSYPTREAQAADWPHHRHECVAFDSHSLKVADGGGGNSSSTNNNTLSLSALLQPSCLRRLLGPYREQTTSGEAGVWTVSPDAQLVEVLCMVDL